MPYNLWGINPLTNKAEAYIGHISSAARPEWEQKAESEGWTSLTWGSDSLSPETESSSEEQDSAPEPSSGRSRRTRATALRIVGATLTVSLWFGPRGSTVPAGGEYETEPTVGSGPGTLTVASSWVEPSGVPPTMSAGGAQEIVGFTLLTVKFEPMLSCAGV